MANPFRDKLAPISDHASSSTDLSYTRVSNLEPGTPVLGIGCRDLSGDRVALDSVSLSVCVRVRRVFAKNCKVLQKFQVNRGDSVARTLLTMRSRFSEQPRGLGFVCDCSESGYVVNWICFKGYLVLGKFERIDETLEIGIGFQRLKSISGTYPSS